MPFQPNVHAACNCFSNTYYAIQYQRSGIPLLSDNNVNASQPVHDVTSSREKHKRASTQRPSHAFVLLTVLTVSNCMFMMPLTVAYSINVFPPEGDLEPRLYAAVIAAMLFYAQAIVDPILFTLALSDLRSTVLTTLRGAFRCITSSF